MKPAIRKTTFADVEPVRRMQARSWLATYPNDVEGISLEWVKAETDSWLTKEAIAKSHEYFKDKLDNPDHYHRIAVNGDGEIVGFIHGSRDEGYQYLGGLYLETATHGTGLAQQMVDGLLGWFDPSQDIKLEVASYNERAKSFYRKYGFEEVPGKNELLKDRIPNVTMIREGKSE